MVYVVDPHDGCTFHARRRQLLAQLVVVLRFRLRANDATVRDVSSIWIISVTPVLMSGFWTKISGMLPGISGRMDC